MKHILLYTDTNDIGGAEEHMFLLAKYLNKENYKVFLACPYAKSLELWVKKFLEEKIPVIQLKVFHKHDPRHLLKLKKIIKNFKINLMHAHVWNPASCRYAYLAAKFAKIPLIITEHDPFKLSPLRNWIKKLLNKNALKILAISEANKKLLENLYPHLRNRLQVVHNGIDATWFMSQLLGFTAKERENYRTNVFNATVGTKVIISVGELHPRKGHEYLIRAMEIVTKNIPQVKLFIAGEGNLRSRLLKIIKKLKLEEKVTLLGKRSDIPQLLASSDLFILPSLNEAFGLVLLEAMCASLPIIATKAGGVPDIIKNNENGVLVEPKDVKSLAYAIIRILKNKELSDKLKNRAHRSIGKFDIKHMVQKIENIYNEVTT